MPTENQLLQRILREAGAPDLIEVLADRLTPTDLQSLLLEVYRRRAAKITAATLLSQHAQNRFVRPAVTDPQVLLAFDQLAFAHSCPPYTPVELAPVAPLGACSTVALAAAHPGVRVGFDPDRADGRAYYTAACFHIFAGDGGGREYQIGDGGFTNWTQQLLGSAKERLLITGLGTERLCSLFAPQPPSERGA